jgi:acyl-coenzyme A thioesterase PaaI-like protein
MPRNAIQDQYPEDLSHCYGCGRFNEHGYQLKSYWDGEEAVARFTPHPEHIAVPGYVYGGLLASLIDCHGTGVAAAAGHRAAGREVGSAPALRYITASLKVDYLKPTPLGVELELHGRPKEVKGRKVVVDVQVFAGGVECVRGEVIAVQVPEAMLATRT